MHNNYFENKIIENAITAFQNNLPEKLLFIVKQNREHINNIRPDIALTLNTGGKEIQYFGEVKNNITNATIGNLLMFRKNFTLPLLLITNHITGNLAEKLKQHNIEYIDTAGNGFINQPPIYIFIKDNKQPVFIRQKTNNRALRPTDLKVVFAFLYNIELLNKTYREIAFNAGIALGAVGGAIQRLKLLGYLVKTNDKQLKLINKENLFQLWNTGYMERLRPKLFLGRYTGTLNNIKENNIKIRIGGETAAEKLTNFLKPQIITLYIKKEYLYTFLIANKLKADINGTIEIYNYFWNPKKNDNEQIAPPLLVYADLIATGDQRNIETAKLIYNEYITNYVR